MLFYTNKLLAININQHGEESQITIDDYFYFRQEQADPKSLIGCSRKINSRFSMGLLSTLFKSNVKNKSSSFKIYHLVDKCYNNNNTTTTNNNNKNSNNDDDENHNNNSNNLLLLLLLLLYR